MSYAGDGGGGGGGPSWCKKHDLQSQMALDNSTTKDSACNAVQRYRLKCTKLAALWTVLLSHSLADTCVLSGGYAFKQLIWVIWGHLYHFWAQQQSITGRTSRVHRCWLWWRIGCQLLRRRSRPGKPRWTLNLRAWKHALICDDELEEKLANKVDKEGFTRLDDKYEKLILALIGSSGTVAPGTVAPVSQVSARRITACYLFGTNARHNKKGLCFMQVSQE